MAKFATLFIDRSYERLVGAALWLLVFILTLTGAAGLAAFQVNRTMLGELNAAILPQIEIRDHLHSTVAAMQRIVTAPPCSALFRDQLREIAFLPDGLSEFLYAPGGIARCSASSDFAPHDLGVPDLKSEDRNFSIWYETELDFLGLPNLTGTIVLIGSFAAVVPQPQPPQAVAPWLTVELISLSSSGAFWHRGGEPGVYEQSRSAGPLAGLLPLKDGSFFARLCILDGITCVAAKARLSDVISANLAYIFMGFALCAVLALVISGQLHAILRRTWSFEARFLRHFKAPNIICTYQPIKALVSDTISGCEVLVRWRDIDGTTVFPDQFLPIIARHNLGRQLTRFVVDRAFHELSASVPTHLKLQVNFNIFPRDLDAAWLRETLSCFDPMVDRFKVVVEIVESDEVEIEHAQREIEALRRAGIKTHLDDFGTGYSNIQNLASLALEGVKLDRSFAMSNDGSLMSRMLVSTIDMIHAAGHRITVEGVETEDRLRMLKATGQVDFVQGYLISRPLEIGRFVTFLDEQNTPALRRPRLVA
jgi:sensor c-di-GMP phosphodiesterase-like protein